MGYRRATTDDIPALCEARKSQLVDEGLLPNASIDEELSDYFTRSLQDGTLVQWVFEDKGSIVATSAIAFMPFPPTFSNPAGTRGYVTNMYTAPSHRNRGIATTMLGLLVDEARKRGVAKLLLGASSMGRSVYSRFGFVESNKYMELDI